MKNSCFETLFNKSNFCSICGDGNPYKNCSSGICKHYWCQPCAQKRVNYFCSICDKLIKFDDQNLLETLINGKRYRTDGLNFGNVTSNSNRLSMLNKSAISVIKKLSAKKYTNQRFDNSLAPRQPRARNLKADANDCCALKVQEAQRQWVEFQRQQNQMISHQNRLISQQNRLIDQKQKLGKNNETEKPGLHFRAVKNRFAEQKKQMEEIQNEQRDFQIQLQIVQNNQKNYDETIKKLEKEKQEILFGIQSMKKSNLNCFNEILEVLELVKNVVKSHARVNERSDSGEANQDESESRNNPTESGTGSTKNQCKEPEKSSNEPKEEKEIFDLYAQDWKNKLKKYENKVDELISEQRKEKESCTLISNESMVSDETDQNENPSVFGQENQTKKDEIINLVTDLTRETPYNNTRIDKYDQFYKNYFGQKKKYDSENNFRHAPKTQENPNVIKNSENSLDKINSAQDDAIPSYMKEKNLDYMHLARILRDTTKDLADFSKKLTNFAGYSNEMNGKKLELPTILEEKNGVDSSKSKNQLFQKECENLAVEDGIRTTPEYNEEDDDSNEQSIDVSNRASPSTDLSEEDREEQIKETILAQNLLSENNNLDNLIDHKNEDDLRKMTLENQYSAMNDQSERKKMAGKIVNFNLYDSLSEKLHKFEEKPNPSNAKDSVEMLRSELLDGDRRFVNFKEKQIITHEKTNSFILNTKNVEKVTKSQMPKPKIARNQFNSFSRGMLRKIAV